jgi:hypothetical protein
MPARTIAIGLAAALCCQTASAQEASASGKLWALSPKATARQAQRDLNALLTPAERYPRGFEGVLYRHGVQEVSFVTPPFNADFPGLCARDTLTMRYAATRPIVGTRTPTTCAFGLTASKRRANTASSGPLH